MADLFIIIKRKYFHQIKSGIKTEEYRNITDYWSLRLTDRVYDVVVFQSGYRKDSPRVSVKFNGVIKKTIIHEFFNNKPTGVFAIQLGDIVV